MTGPMLPLPGLSPVPAKKIMASFDGGLLSSDGGVPMLREVESRLAVAERLAACIADPLFKMAHDLRPSDRDLCSQSTISRMENRPGPRALIGMGRADRKSTRLNSSHLRLSRMPSSA